MDLDTKGFNWTLLIVSKLGMYMRLLDNLNWINKKGYYLMYLTKDSLLAWSQQDFIEREL